MDNYDLSNLPLLSQSADSRDYDPWLTEEQNRRATFSRRSTVVSAPEQAKRQQLPWISDEQISEQKLLADFDISLSPNILDPLIADELKDPFAELAAYQPLSFDDDTGQPLESNLGLFGDINISDALLAEPEGNDVLEQPEQSQGKSDAKGIVISESVTPDTVSGERQGKRRLAFESVEPRKVIIIGMPEPSIEQSIERHFQKSLRKSARLSQKKQELRSTQTELLRSPQGVATSSQSAATPEKSATSREDIEPGTDQSLLDRIKRETNELIVIREGERKQFMCGYPNCSYISSKLTSLRKHIFNHIRISRYKCTHPECGDNRYFRDASTLKRHVQSHTHERSYTRKNFRRQNPDESLRERVKRETEKWIAVGEDRQEQFMCSYPNCGYVNTQIVNLKTHIFNHIKISRYKCTYPECGDNTYFRDATALKRHVQISHTHERPYFCEICKKRFGRSDGYKRHMFLTHKTAP